MRVDRTVIGAGFFGLYAAHLLTSAGKRVAIVDVESDSMRRASLINQARVHLGYHYPRSVHTAMGAGGYFRRFVADFPEAINDRFEKIYAISAQSSFTNAASFRKFCDRIDIPAIAVDPALYFLPGMVEAAWKTSEFSFDAPTLRSTLTDRIDRTGLVDWFLGTYVSEQSRPSDAYCLTLASGITIETEGVVNATYAGMNGILDIFGQKPVDLKYELCEVILTDAAPALANVGVTVLDGPFFSIMPFGDTGMHSLTAVPYTPRSEARGVLPEFPCQSRNPACHPERLENCTSCAARPGSAWPLMRQLALKFLRPEFAFSYRTSLFTVKAVPQESEVDDSRPTLLLDSEDHSLVSVFSGKINTIYDLESVL